MDLYEMLFMIGFLVSIGITLYKLYNALNEFTLYEWKEGIILFVGYILSWAVTFYLSMIKYSITEIRILFRLNNVMFGLNALFFIVETIYLLRDIMKNSNRQRYQPENAYRR